MKKNMRIVTTLAALVAALAVKASPVLDRDAQYAAKGWGILNSKAFGALGEVENVTAERNAAGKVQWYVVKMTKGAVVVAPDDEIEPVIAVVPGSDGVIPAGSPLRAMLEHDMSNRLARVSGRAGGLKLSASSLSSASVPEETSKWNKLRQYGRGRVLKTSAGEEKTPATIVRWLDGWNSGDTVKGVQTLRFWNQNYSEDYFDYYDFLFDKYTPGNSPCGCVATAGSSVIHYFRVPSGNVMENACTYNGAETMLTTKGGTYDWSLIDSVSLKRFDPVPISEDVADLLGRVAYDCGVGCGMDYGDAGSGTWTKNLMQSFRNVFNMANVQLATQNGTMMGPGDGSQDIGPANYADLIYNQIRGGAPVVLGIYMHEVVACGYGFDEDKTDYTYIFSGWGGNNDAWYALPTIDTKSTVEGGEYTSTFIDEVLTEIAPFDDKYVAVVGQVVDADGVPVPDSPVTMSNGEEVRTDKNGFFGTRVSPLDLPIVTDAYGEEHAYTVGAAAGRTTEAGAISSALAAALPDAMVVELLEPSVRVGGDDTRVYGSLTKALASVMPGETVEILKPTVFKKSVTVPVSCTIFAATADAAEAFVRHANDAVITVPDGVTVTVSNVCFKTESGEVEMSKPQVFDVQAGGTLRLGSRCRMGAIKTAVADGLAIAAPLTDSLYVTCAAATKEGMAFAKYTTNYATASGCAHFLRHSAITRLGGKAVSTGNIVWAKDVPVADDIAVAKTVIGGTSANYAAVDDVFDVLKEGGVAVPVEIVVIKDGTFTRKHELKSSLTIRGEGAEKPVLATDTTAGFVVGDGTALVLANVTFAGMKPKNEVDEIRFIDVVGGALTLADGAELSGITGRRKDASGVIDLINGTVTMEEGSVIANCAAEGVGGRGGAIYVNYRSDCVLNLLGGAIVDCHAAYFGGGVYVYNHSLAWSPEVNVAGALTIADNWSENEPADDIYLFSGKTISKFNVVDALDGQVGIWYGSGASDLNEEGEAFVSNAIGEGVDDQTLFSFFSDAREGFVAAKGTGDKAGKLVWAVDARDPRQCDAREAAAKLIAGGNVSFWREVSDALNEAPDNGIVEVLKGQTLASNVDIGGRVMLRTAGTESARLTLVRAKDVSISIPAGSGLSVTNMDFNGYNSDGVSCTPLFAVDGGVLEIDDVLIRDVTGGTNRNANAVTVFRGGTFEMRNSQISGCWNDAVDPSGVPEKTSDAGAGGGLLVDNATAYLLDSSIANCRATWGGGAFACNGSTVHISGDVRVADNTANGAPSNLMASDTSSLVLAGALTGVARVSHLEYSLERPGDTNVVANVGYDWDVASLTNSAAKFERDLDGSPAVAVTNGTAALIVWCGAAANGVYTNVSDGVVYKVAGKLPVATPSSGYQQTFGTANAFATEPVVEIVGTEIARGGLKVSVLVKDGATPVAVDPAKVASLFEATSDVRDWSKQIDIVATPVSSNADSSVTFTITPAGNPPAAFIRLRY